MMKFCSKYALHDASVLVKHSPLPVHARGRVIFLIGRTSKTFSRSSSPARRMTESKYIQVGDYSIFPWATSGLESSIIVNGPGKRDRIAFDMGYAHKETFNCSDVFISHGHMDHIAGIPSHAAIRTLKSCKGKSTYYIPTHLKEPLLKVLEGYSAMTEENLLDQVNLKTVDPGTEIKLSSDRVVRVFPTIHRVKSQGYIVMRKYKKLKEEYKQLPGPELGKLAKDGVQIRDETWEPDVAYTGDSTFEIFHDPPDTDLLKVKLLITESTYIDDEIDKQGRDGQQRARERGHMHLQEFIDNAHLFKDINKIILLHFSDKYSIKYLKEKSTEMLQGTCLQDKVIIGSTHKEIFG